MDSDVFVLVFLALIAVWMFLDKIGDARVLEAEARKLEAEARLPEDQERGNRDG